MNSNANDNILRISTWLIFGLFPILMQGQCMAGLDYLNRGKRVRIQSGTFIEVELKNDVDNKYRVSGEVNIDCDGYFVFPEGDKIAYQDVVRLSMPRRGLWNSVRGIFYLGGKMYFGITSFNGLVNNDSPIIPPEAVPILLGSELMHQAVKWHQKRWFKVKPGKREIKWIDLRP